MIVFALVLWHRQVSRVHWRIEISDVASSVVMPVAQQGGYTAWTSKQHHLALRVCHSVKQCRISETEKVLQRPLLSHASQGCPERHFDQEKRMLFHVNFHR